MFSVLFLLSCVSIFYGEATPYSIGYSNTHVYVKKSGCDYGNCSSPNTNYSYACPNQQLLLHTNTTNPTSYPSQTPTNTQTYHPTCKTIDYAWRCFLGEISGFPSETCSEYDGNGEFNMGSGLWDFSYQLHFDIHNVTISGQGANTIWQYSGNESTWVKCRWYKCRLQIQDLTMISTRTSTTDTQFEMSDGGTLIVINVIFNGNNYQTAQGQPFWIFNDERDEVIFLNCYFINNDVMYEISNGANASFINCTFISNKITLGSSLSFSKDQAMFYIDSANVLFENCVFINNTQNNRTLFNIQNTATVSIISTKFLRNKNYNTNNNMFTIGADVDISFVDSLFENNTGYHGIIYWGIAVLRHLCVTLIPHQCETVFNLYDIPLISLREIPGASVILYVYGFDAFVNPLITTEFSIQISASGGIQIINPFGIQSTANEKQYVVPLIVSTAKDREGEIIVEDIKGIADPFYIKVQVRDCDPGYHQNKIAGDSDLFDCNYCPIHKYTMATSPCKNCEKGLECWGGNVIFVKENYYGKVGVDTCNYDPDNSYITTTLCPPGYCCSKSKCRFPNRFSYTMNDDLKDPNINKCNITINSTRRRLVQDTYTDTEEANPPLNFSNTVIQLCAPNRDPSVPMCGACLPGYYETLSSTGSCAKCNDSGMSNEWL
eukprot:410400_1